MDSTSSQRQRLSRFCFNCVTLSAKLSFSTAALIIGYTARAFERIIRLELSIVTKCIAWEEEEVDAGGLLMARYGPFVNGK